VSGLRPGLESIYPPDEDRLIGITAGGLWHATPLSMLTTAVPLLVEAGLVPPRGVVFDAGAGDGRVLAALALGLQACGREARIAGLELDGSLAAQARLHLDDLRRAHPRARARIAQGDYFHPRFHEVLGHRPEDIDLVLHYPDGNERRLLAWLGDRGKPEARLAVLSPERQPDLGFPPILSRDVRPAGSPVAWTLAVYGSRA